MFDAFRFVVSTTPFTFIEPPNTALPTLSLPNEPVEVDEPLTVPAESNSQAPDQKYMPVLKKGSTFLSENNTVFSLLEDVDFSLSKNPIVVADQDANTGNPSSYAVKTTGQVVSGELAVQEIAIGEYTPFLNLHWKIFYIPHYDL